MQAVLPFGILAILAFGVVLVAFAFETDETDGRDRGGVVFHPHPSEVGTHLLVSSVRGTPSWLDIDVRTADRVPVPHRYEDRDHDGMMDVGETLVLAGHPERHIGAQILHHGQAIYTVVQADPEDPTEDPRNTRE